MFRVAPSHQHPRLAAAREVERPEYPHQPVLIAAGHSNRAVVSRSSRADGAARAPRLRCRCVFAVCILVSSNQTGGEKTVQNRLLTRLVSRDAMRSMGMKKRKKKSDSMRNPFVARPCTAHTQTPQLAKWVEVRISFQPSHGGWELSR
jgi:hypothetical protein